MAEDLQRILECPMCLEFYDSSQRVPKLLQCQHTFCLPCLLMLEQRHIITCPQCRKDQTCPRDGPGRIANNFTMLALIEVQQKSSSKSSPGPKIPGGETHPNQRLPPKPPAQAPQVSENVRVAITNLAQKLQERSNVMKSFEDKEKATKDNFVRVRKEIESSFDARMKELTARRNTLIKQLGEIGIEEVSFIQTQKSSALQYLKKFQEDFLKMKHIFRSGVAPSEMQLMQLLNVCQGYNRQIEDYALSVDERTCDITYTSPTLEQLLISINSYGCLTVSKQRKNVISAPSPPTTNQEAPSTPASRPATTGSQTPTTASLSNNPFHKREAVENRYEAGPQQSLPALPLRTEQMSSESRSAGMTRHLSLDVANDQSSDRERALSNSGNKHHRHRRPMSTSFSSNQVSAAGDTWSQTPPSTSSSAARTLSSNVVVTGSVNRSQSNPSLTQLHHMLSPMTGMPGQLPSPMGPLNILGPDVTGRSIFEKPSGIALLGGGLLAVVDEIKHCLMIVTHKGQMVQVLGSQGNGIGEFQFPKAVCCTGNNPDDNYVISDWWNHRIQIWDKQGRSVGQFGIRGNEQNQLNGPVGVASDQRGNIFVCDFNNHCVKVFTKDGRFLRQIGKEGSRDGHFLNPSGIVLSRAGEVLVTDSGKHCVQVFTQGGTFLYRFGEWGAEPGQLNCPSGIAVDSHGYIFVSNRGNHRVEVFNPSGSFARCYGTHGSELGQFDEPMGLAVLEDGRVAVCDAGNKRIQMVRP